MIYSDLIQALNRLGIFAPGNTPKFTELTGGISSEIYRVDAGGRTICVKRALPTLKTDPDWHVPVGRSAAEFDYMTLAESVLPGIVPAALGYDAAANLLAMEFLPPERFSNWKECLRDGEIAPETAGRLAAALAAIHNATAGDREVAARFAHDDVFHAIRLESYFLASADREDRVAEPLRQVAAETLAAKKALVHGDVSPKNVLVEKDGTGGRLVLLDAECAWYGEPAFDAAFCLTHFLLKAIWRPQWLDKYLECFHVFAEAWLAAAVWEPRADIERVAARLLAAMILARVIGRSPVEYITDQNMKDRIREFAVAAILSEPAHLQMIAAGWRNTFSMETPS